MKKVLFLLLALVIMTGVIGCTQQAAAGELKSDKPRITTPAVSEADMQALIQGNGEFAFNLYQLLAEEDGNMFYSPYSISAALAMTYAGARGETATEMADAMHYMLAQDALHAAFNDLALQLASRGEGAQGKDDEGFRLNVVNAVWGQKDFEFLSSYLDLLAENYGAGLRVLDFINSPDPSREAINQWVSEQTEGRIEDLIPEGSITSLTRLVLTNAVYFNAAWLNEFDPHATADGVFHLADGTEVTVPMMHQSKNLNYALEDDILAVELPYDGNELSMVILTNAAGDFGAFQNKLDYAAIESVLGSLRFTNVNLAMPKFEFESEYSLNTALQQMGMVNAFLDTADFTGITQASNLFISEVVHKAFVSVDEAGTEAAAATGVVMNTSSMPVDPVTVTLDHPFIFLIRDVQTGAILFVGHVMDPSL